jgi:hypothetical protein
MGGEVGETEIQTMGYFASVFPLPSATKRTIISTAGVKFHT